MEVVAIDQHIPVVGTCVDCGKAIKARSHGYQREVLAWEQVRRSGTNPIRYPEATGRYRCRGCATEQKLLQSESLF